MTTTEEFLAALRATAGGTPVKVKVRKWPELHVRQVLVDEAEEHARDTKDPNDKHGFARAAARVMCNGDGKPLLDWRNEEHVKLLGRQPWPMLQKVLGASEGVDEADPEKK